MQHLISIRDLSVQQATELLINSESMLEISGRELKKVPALRGKTIINLFFEPSTRTRTSFEIATKWLSGDAINVNIANTSAKKGETTLDTAWNLQAMSPDAIVVRHQSSGVPYFLAGLLKKTAIINGGDGRHEHPTQALLDVLTLKRHFGEIPTNKTVAIVGDVVHSRVARSTMLLLRLFGNEVRFVGPKPLVPDELADIHGGEKIPIFNKIEEGIKDVDVVIVLRMQLERQESFFVPTMRDYFRSYCLTRKRLDYAKPGAIVMHPGPMNRGIEISTEVAECPTSMIMQQVESGLAVRMAVLIRAVTKVGSTNSDILGGKE